MTSTHDGQRIEGVTAVEIRVAHKNVTVIGCTIGRAS